MSRLTQRLLLFGLLSMWCFTVWMSVVFFYAMSQGGEAIIPINTIGEMWIEAAIIPFVLVICTWTTVKLWKSLVG